MIFRIILAGLNFALKRLEAVEAKADDKISSAMDTHAIVQDALSQAADKATAKLDATIAKHEDVAKKAAVVADALRQVLK